MSAVETNQLFLQGAFEGFEPTLQLVLYCVQYRDVCNGCVYVNLEKEDQAEVQEASRCRIIFAADYVLR